MLCESNAFTCGLISYSIGKRCWERVRCEHTSGWEVVLTNQGGNVLMGAILVRVLGEVVGDTGRDW